MENDSGLKRALEPGDEVILSTGATATVRGSYPQGYTGDVVILLGDAEETERAIGLTLPDNPPIEVRPELADITAAQQSEMGEIRAPSRRMED
jgi:hypothetical protein